MYGEPHNGNQDTVIQLTSDLREGMGQRLLEFRQYVAPLDTMSASQPRLDLIVGAIERTAQMEAYASGYAERADAFQRAGQPALRELVDFALNDMAGATRIYVQMYQDTVETMTRMRQIMNEAQHAATVNTLISVLDSQARFDRSMRQIIGVNTSSCGNCGLYFGTSAPYWRWCPRCGAAR